MKNSEITIIGSDKVYPYKWDVVKNVFIKRLDKQKIECKLLQIQTGLTTTFIGDNYAFKSKTKNSVKVKDQMKKTYRLTKKQEDFLKETLFSLAEFLKADILFNNKKITLKDWPQTKNYPF